MGDDEGGGPGANKPPELPPLREVVARHRLTARKALGQNFLFDRNLIARIARAAGDLAGHAAIEVGAGPGGLTRALLAGPAREVVAIERDPRCLAALEELRAHYPDRLRIVAGDALALDLARLAAAPRAVVANLPYNIATPLLVRWMAEADAFASFTLMFQKEVAERLLAAPGSKVYGRLSILCQWRCAVERLFDVDRRAFTPSPKVTSTLVRLAPRPAPLAPAEPEALSRVVAAAFGQRRKMLRASLRSLGVDTEALIAAAGLEPTARAETIDITGFCALARAYARMRPG